MTLLTSDQKEGPEHPSTLSQRMIELQEVVFTEWEKRLRACVKEADALSHPILINTLPALYGNLVEALSPGYPRTSAATVTPSVALEHGNERARLTRYEAQALIAEYQLLRSTILDVLKQNKVPVSDAETQIISSVMDAAIREAVTAFALTQSAFREQFVAALAHDLRSPLSTASIAAQLIQRTSGEEKTQRHAQQIIENIERVDLMVRDLLDTVIFHHGERLTLHYSHFDIADVVKEVCDQAAVSHGPRFEIQGISVMGWWGREAIQRALENLISNAVKYGAPDTTIRIAFKEYHGRLMLSVHNDGDAIPPDQVETVFQVFRRAKAAKEGGKQGWGVGLPFARSVAESHGGSIDVDSATERGTTFSIDIPVDARPFQNAPTLGSGV
jgi:signal transduction histidine kinase